MNRILIVDDDARNIFALKAVLQSKGFDVVAADNAAEGIGLIKKDPSIRVVLMDVMMPEMDGYEAIQIIRNDKTLVHVKLVAVTAQAKSGDREKCMAAGADEYISKPIDVTILFQLLKQYIPEQVNR